MSLDSVDKHNIDEEAAALARRDLFANRISAIEKYAAELTEKAKDSKSSKEDIK